MVTLKLTDEQAEALFRALEFARYNGAGTLFNSYDHLRELDYENICFAVADHLGAKADFDGRNFK